MEDTNKKRIAIKFLLNNSMTGTLIGAGGKAIKELMACTKARVQVSGTSETYPGSSDRVILVSGDPEAVEETQKLIWEMLALVGANAGVDARTIDWSPQAAQQTPSEHDEVPVTARFTIPASAGGAVLGKAGSVIQAIASESGAKLNMTSKEEALFTQERILTVSGTTAAAKECTRRILEKLAEGEDNYVFVNKGTTYASPLSNSLGLMGGRRMAPRRQEEGVDVVSDTTITLAVPDELIGHILGKGGATMREIISLSGASVVVSKRGEYVEGTTNRLVTITGQPAAAQTAHLFITQRLHTPANPTPRPPRK